MKEDFVILIATTVFSTKIISIRTKSQGSLMSLSIYLKQIYIVVYNRRILKSNVEYAYMKI